MNKATNLYSILNNENYKHVFQGVTPDEDEDEGEDEVRIEILVEADLLDKVVKAQQKGAKFTWNKNAQLWTLGNLNDTIDPDPDPDPNTSEFEFDNNTGTILRYIGGGGDIVIPSQIDGVEVKAIERNAFRGKGLTSVTIPDTVTSIGFRAFYGNELIKVTIEGSGTKINWTAFHNNIPGKIDFASIPPFFWQSTQGTWKMISRIWWRQ